MPVSGLLDAITGMLARVAPGEVLSIIQDQILKIANDKSGGLLTLGMLGTIWSTSSGMTAIIDTLNQAYDIQESRPWWKVRLIAIGLTIALAVFIVVSFDARAGRPDAGRESGGLGAHGAGVHVDLEDPAVAGRLRAWSRSAIALIYYFAPDAEQEWVWITPGLGPRDRPLADHLARLQVLRRQLHVVQRDLRRHRRRRSC